MNKPKPIRENISFWHAIYHFFLILLGIHVWSSNGKDVTDPFYKATYGRARWYEYECQDCNLVKTKIE